MVSFFDVIDSLIFQLTGHFETTFIEMLLDPKQRKVVKRNLGCDFNEIGTKIEFNICVISYKGPNINKDSDNLDDAD